MLDRLEYLALTRLGPFWAILQKIKPIDFFVNRLLIDAAVTKVRPRLHPLSTMADYTSWDSLIDRTYSARHLPPSTIKEADLPPAAAVAELFRRPRGGMREAAKSTVLFSYFAQWFTDAFLRANYDNPLKNTSNHEIDLSNLYGLRREVTDRLRSRVDGKLASQIINGEEYPPYYYLDGRPVEAFAPLPMTKILPRFEQQLGRNPLDDSMFAMGGDRMNSQLGFAAMNVLFLREHNRICDVLKQKANLRDDEQLFQTARNVLIIMLIKIVIEEYINHITPYHFRFRACGGAFEKARWYRQNWMAVEFNLLYRWHPLVPDVYQLGGREFPLEQTFFNNRLLIDNGLGTVLEGASRQPAGELGLHNTPDALMHVEAMSIDLCRKARLASYNEYRKFCGFPLAQSFGDITDNLATQQALKDVYGHVDRVEYYPGIFAEDVTVNAAVPSTIGRLVSVDAFSQALTNPLLAQNIYTEKTFTRAGLEIIEDTKDLASILNRNLPPGGRRFLLSMDRPHTTAGTASTPPT
jgi:prostaglandin-endoperoxide synthase 2